MKKDPFGKEACEIMKSAARYATQRGAYAGDYVYQQDFYQIKTALQKGVPNWKTRTFYKGLFEGYVEADAREIRRDLPRSGNPAFEEAGVSSKIKATSGQLAHMIT